MRTHPSRRRRSVAALLLLAMVVSVAQLSVPAASAATGSDTVVGDFDYLRYTNRPDVGTDHLSVNVSSLPSGENPTGSFAMTCGSTEPGCYPYASESVDCVNVQGSVAVVSGPISQDWDPSTHYRVTLVFFDRDADGLPDSFMFAGMGSNSSGEPGNPNCTMSAYQPYYDVQAGDIAITDVPGTTTPTGTDVVVAPSDQNGPSNVELKFGDVSEAGTTTLTTSADGPGPTGFALGDPAVYYNLETTATFTGEVEVCIQLTHAARR